MKDLRTNGALKVLLLGLLLLGLAGCEGESDAKSDPAPAGSAAPAIGGGTGVAVLSWAPPTTNTDGSPVDLLGYVIYQGSSPTNLTALRMVGILDTTTVIDNLPAGTHFFAVAAVSMSGAQSALSNVQSKTI